MKVNNCGEMVEVKSLEEASKIIRAKIDAEFMGGDDWYSRSHENGNAYDDGGKWIAHISYNGRIWPAKEAVAHCY